MCVRRGDLRSPAGERSSPLPCYDNILMRTLLMPFFKLMQFLWTVGDVGRYFFTNLRKKDLCKLLHFLACRLGEVSEGKTDAEIIVFDLTDLAEGQKLDLIDVRV